MLTDRYFKGTDEDNIGIPGFTALNVLGDACLVINASLKQVTWVSDAFSKLYKEIPSNSLDVLLRMFGGLGEAIQEVADHKTLKRNAIVMHKRKTSVGVEIKPLDLQHYLLRFKNLAEKNNEIQRYLEDREQLFLTSRTLSVSEMATTLAHEINQPIGTIRNLLHGIKRRLQPNENINESTHSALERAIEQTDFAARIINRIRDYTQARTPEKTPLDLRKLIQDCLSLLDWELDRQDVNCQLIIPAEPLEIIGDELMLQQVLINLLRNAIDAMRDSTNKKMLLITGQHENGQITIQIRDSGCGLSEEAEANLFQPFVSTKPTGMGVGLNICRSFVELHQGRLWLTANDQTGCTSHVQLPTMVNE